MNGSPEHGDAPAASSTSSAAPPPAAPATPSPAPPSPAVPPAAPTSAAQAAAAPAAEAPVPPVPAAPMHAAPHPPPAGHPVPPGQGGVSVMHRKSPALAGLLSLMPGIGQIYVGYYRVGFIHMVVFAMTIALLASGPPRFGPFSMIRAFYPALAILLVFFAVYNIVDACRRATLYNLALDGVPGIELPELNASLPKFQGSMGGGVALIALGVLLLSNTLFGLSLDWLASWWPLGLVGLGAYLVVKARQERRAGDPPAGGGE